MLLGTVIVERVIDVLSLLLIIIITILVQFDLVKNFFLENIVYELRDKISGLIHASWFIPAAVGGTVILILAVVYFMRSEKSPKLITKIRELLKGILQGIRSVRNIRSLPVFIFHTVFIWTMYFFMSYFCFFALDATSGLGWQAGLLVLVAGGIGMSAPVQGGIGTYHLMVSQGLIIYGILKDHGMAYATIMHGSGTLVVILLGFIGYVVLWFGNKKLKNADA